MYLSCWFYCAPIRIFITKTDTKSSLSRLQEQIQDEWKSLLTSLNQNDIKFWKVPFNFDNDSLKDIKLGDDVGVATELTGLAHKQVGRVFPPKDVDNHLLVIQLPSRLLCWVHGQPEEKRFRVQTHLVGDSVGYLKKRIKELDIYMFDKVLDYDFIFWKVPFRHDKDSVNDIKLADGIGGVTKLIEYAEVNSVFPSEDVDNHLLVIQLPPMLWCWIDVQPKEKPFRIQTHRDDTVDDLEERIKEMWRPCFNSVPVDNLVLWKVEINNFRARDLPPLPVILQDGQAGARKLSGEETIQSIFPEPVPNDRLSVIIEGTKPIYEVAVYETNRENVAALKKNFSNTLTTIWSALAPNASAKTSGYPMSNIAYCICDDAKIPRSTFTLPVQLFHPVFGHFLDDVVKERKIPNDFAREVADYMTNTLAIHESKNARQIKLTRLLGNLLGIQFINNNNKTRFDGFVEIKTSSGHHAVPLMKESENDFTGGISDPSTKVGLSMARFWIQPRFGLIRNNTCCPTFLIANAGPWISIYGAVFTDVVIIQHLTDRIWMGLDSVVNYLHFERVTRILYSLREGLTRLQDYYNRLELSANVLGSRFFPSITQYHNSSGELIRFEYIGFLQNDPSCATFLAQTLNEGKKIVVKFTERYGKEAHQVLAKENRAPQLYYYGTPRIDEHAPSYNGISMVVMEYIDGKILDKAARTIGLEKVEEELKESLDVLHGHGFVFGDLRIPNVMVTTEGRVKLLDFDWAGIDGETEYPHLMSSAIKWPEGVEPFKVMKKEHDIDMMKMILDDLK